MKISKYFILLILFLISIMESNSAWRRNTTMGPAYSNVVYLDVYFLPANPQFGWACGYEGKIIRTTDGGKTWTGSRIFNRFGFPIEAQLESINFLNENVGYTSGPTNQLNSIGVIYKSTDGGANWFDITPPGVTDLWGNYFLNENVGFVLGGGCGSSQYFWKTTNGGSTWQSLIYNQPGSKMSDAIVYSENGLGYAVGSGWLWKTTNGGNSWLPIRSTGNVDWHEEITNIDQTFLIPYSEGCFGNTETSIGGARFSQDEGRTWQQYNTGVPMFGTYLLDKQRGWAAGFNKTIIYTSDGGKTWSNQNCGIEPGANLDDVWFINDTTGWVVGNGVYEYFIPEAKSPVIAALGDKFEICEGDNVILTANDGFDAYIWSTGETTQQISVSKPGKYAVRGIIDSICYDAMSDFVDVRYFEKYQPDIILSSGGPPCEGDTVEVSIGNKFIDYEWSDGTKNLPVTVHKSSEYTLSLTDTNGCKSTASVKIDFLPNPKPKIKPNGRLNFCIGSSVNLSTTENFSKYKWFEVKDNKIISENNSIDVRESGSYFVEVTNDFGCKGISDTVNVIVRDEMDALEFIYDKNEKEFNLDSAFYLKVNCKNFQIRNTSNKEVSLDDTYLFRNIAFSVPQSQFPIKIPANGMVELKICFSPKTLGINLDTVLFSDICSDHIIKLLGFGETETFIDRTKCDVPIEFELSGLSNKIISFGIGDIYPNPAGSDGYIKFSAIGTNLNNFTNEISVSCYSVLGEKVDIDYMITATSEIDNVLNGMINLKTNSLDQGIYMVVTNIYGKYITNKLVISK